MIEQLSLDQLTLSVGEEIHVRASLEATFETLLEQMGPYNETPYGEKLPMTLEPWPGGRWFRDLGDNTGHLWGHVQVIKPPKLLEISGPMMASYPAVNHIQYRLTPEGDGTRLKLTHRAFGWMPAGFVQGADEGFVHWLKAVGEIAMRLKAERRKGGGR